MQNRLNHLLYRYSKYIKLIFFIWDIILLNATYMLSFYIRFGNFDRLQQEESKSIFAISNILWFGIIIYMEEYKFIRILHIDRILTKSIKNVLLHIFLIMTLIYLLHFDAVSRLRMLYFCSLFFTGIFFSRIIFLQILKYLRKQGYNYRYIAIIGAGTAGQQIHSILTNDMSHGYRVIGYFDDEAKSTKKIKILGRLSDIQEFVKSNPVHEIYVAENKFDEKKINELINFCESYMVRIKFVPDFRMYTKTRKVNIDFYDDVPVITLRKEPLELPQNKVIKRLFDIVFSLLVFLLIFPWLFPILFILIKLSSKGPVLFKQKRSGVGNSVFYCYKFRTMRVNSLADQLQATKNDPRITTVGKFLRKSNLDEWPQFFSVLKGDMSVIGPRPHMLKHTEEFSKLINNYLVRHYVRPGITGWAQVNGYRGETTHFYQLEKRVKYDIWYIENWSFLLDIYIIYRTVFNMFKGEKNAV